MPSDRFPGFYLFGGDFLSSTSHMSAEEVGAYLRLLIGLYERGGSLRNDRILLSRIAGVTLKRWGKIWPVISEKFYADGSELKNKRADQELQKRDQISQKRRTSALKKGQRNQQSEPAKAGFLQEYTYTYTKDISLAKANSPLFEEKAGSESAPKKRARKTYRDEFVKFWEAYPSTRGKALAERAFDKARSKVELDVILAGLEHYKSSKPDYADWKHAATWLNQEGWRDLEDAGRSDTSEPISEDLAKVFAAMDWGKP